MNYYCYEFIPFNTTYIKFKGMPRMWQLFPYLNNRDRKNNYISQVCAEFLYFKVFK